MALFIIRQAAVAHKAPITRHVSSWPAARNVFRELECGEFRDVFGYNHANRSVLTEHRNMTLAMVKIAHTFMGTFLVYAEPKDMHMKSRVDFKTISDEEEEGDTERLMRQIKSRALLVGFRNLQTPRRWYAPKMVGACKEADARPSGLSTAHITRISSTATCSCVAIFPVVSAPSRVGRSSPCSARN